MPIQVFFRTSSRSLILFIILLGSLFITHPVNALKNVTIDDQDPRIIYSPNTSWTFIDGPDLDAGGSHMLAEDDPGATATITFTFVSVYFMSTLWPYQVRDNLVIDDGEPVLVDLQDYSRPDVGQGTGTVASSVVAWYEGTESSEHTIVVSVPPGVKYSVVDMFIFTVEDSDPTNTISDSGATNAPGPGFSTSPPATAGTSTPTSTAIEFTTATHGTASPTPSDGDSASRNSPAVLATSKTRTLRIALGVIIPLLALLLLAALWCFCRRRHRSRGSDASSTLAPVLLPPSVRDPGDGLDNEERSNNGSEDGRSLHPASAVDGLASNSHNFIAGTGTTDRSQNWDGSSRRGSSTYYSPSSSRPLSQTLLNQQPTGTSSIYSVPTRQRGDGLASTPHIVVANPPSYQGAYYGSSMASGSGTMTASSGPAQAAAAPPSSYRKPSKKVEETTVTHSIFGGDEETYNESSKG